MASEKKNTCDLHSAIHGMRWDEVRRITRRKPRLINEKYLGMTSLQMIVLAKAPENLVLEILEDAEKEVIDDVNLKVAGRSIVYYLALYGYVDALRRALEKSQNRVNWQTEGDDTPLHVLLQGKHSFRIHLHGLQVLLDAGADSKLKNQNGLTPIDVYVQNKCDEYENTNAMKQKEEILQLLYSVAVPGEVLARGKQALSAFNKDLEKGQITVNQVQLVGIGGLEGIVKPLMLDITKM
ncbi:uncharacterized protein LOC117104028 [Anneissia japonica]|uniref:uncharacterized protein LOC117104028 n=1 Tax=Anneissia japonica TaxID=1529436 RepID=UPI00142585BA|nr:uncharacterized protein LOC117104028 [Anneissia japonica]